MKKLRDLDSPVLSLNDQRLTTTTPLAKSAYAECLADSYRGTPKQVVYASLMNAIYTHKTPVFVMSSRLLAKLITNDSNTDITYKSKLSGDLYIELRQKLLATRIVGNIVCPADFEVLVEGTGSKADLWTLSGDMLEDFWAEFPDLKQHYELIKSSAVAYYSTTEQEPEYKQDEAIQKQAAIPFDSLVLVQSEVADQSKSEADTGKSESGITFEEMFHIGF
jgi:hypothetical protein